MSGPEGTTSLDRAIALLKKLLEATVPLANPEIDESVVSVPAEETATLLALAHDVLVGARQDAARKYGTGEKLASPATVSTATLMSLSLVRLKAKEYKIEEPILLALAQEAAERVQSQETGSPTMPNALLRAMAEAAWSLLEDALRNTSKAGT